MEHTVTLNDGVKIPQIGFGTFQIANDGSTYKAVREALDLGYRHIDTAAAYFNEEEVGRAIKDSGLAREEIFVTSKLWLQDYGFEKASAGLDTSLRKLGLDYIDLYLLHQPYGEVAEAWRALEQGKAQGKVRSIGVSNMTVKIWQSFVPHFKTQPSVNQIEYNPYCLQKEIRKLMAQTHTTLEGWGPLGRGMGTLLKDPVIDKIAKAHDKTCAQDYLYTTAVFLNQDLNEVFEIAKTSKFDYLQFHGQESLAYIQKVKDKFPKLKLIKALNIYDPNFKEDYQSFAKLCDLILLDSKNPGSGKSFDWTDIPSFVDKSRTLLSGGIKLSNLKEALELGFIGLDLSSGAEIVKGQKDLGLIQDLMHKILE